MKQITLSDMQQQSEAAASAPRLRAHRNFHPELKRPDTASGHRHGTRHLHPPPPAQAYFRTFAAAERPICGTEF